MQPIFKNLRTDNNQGESIQEYLCHFSNVTVQYPKWFGVKIGKDAVFPAEFCDIVPGQFYKRMLDESQRSELVSSATKHPNQRLRSITDAVAGEVHFSSLPI